MPEVRIKLRDLDTDAQTIQLIEVDRIPDNLLRQEQQLAELVARIEPKARQRSFEDGVASYVGSQHLIVATYLAPAATRDKPTASEGEAPAERQDQLFAA